MHNPWKLPPTFFTDNVNGNPQSLEFFLQGTAANSTHSNIVNSFVHVFYEVHQLPLGPIGFKIVYAKKNPDAVHMLCGTN